MHINNERDKSGITDKIEEVVEGLELNPEKKERKEAREKIIEYSQEINKIGKDYEMVYSHFEPKGADGERGFNEEMDLFLKSREEGENYQPIFTYPEMSKQNIDDLQEKITDLKNIETNASNEKNVQVKNVVLEMISVVKAKIGILVEIKKIILKRLLKMLKLLMGILILNCARMPNIGMKEKYNI